jgi:hypothetical protein
MNGAEVLASQMTQSIQTKAETTKGTKVHEGIFISNKFAEEGDVYVNVTWVNEAEFRDLIDLTPA